MEVGAGSCVLLEGSRRSEFERERFLAGRVPYDPIVR